MFDPTSTQIEKLFYSTFGSGLRIAGMSGVARGMGVSSLAESLAARAALSGRRSLLIDLGADVMEAGCALSETWSRSGTANHPFDRLRMIPAIDELCRFRDRNRLRGYFEGHLDRYDLIVVDAAPCNDGGHKAIPGIIAASACDSVVVVARSGAVEAPGVRSAMSALAGVGASVAGMIVHEDTAPRMNFAHLRGMANRGWKNIRSSARLQSMVRRAPEEDGMKGTA